MFCCCCCESGGIKVSKNNFVSRFEKWLKIVSWSIPIRFLRRSSLRLLSKSTYKTKSKSFKLIINLWIIISTRERARRSTMIMMCWVCWPSYMLTSQRQSRSLRDLGSTLTSLHSSEMIWSFSSLSSAPSMPKVTLKSPKTYSISWLQRVEAVSFSLTECGSSFSRWLLTWTTRNQRSSIASRAWR